MPDFSVFTHLSDYVSSLIDHVQRLRGKERGYVFQLDVEEDSLQLYRYFFLSYLRRFPHRYSNGELTDVPEFEQALQLLPRTELNGFTRYVISRLAQEQDRFDFQFYAVVSSLLRQLLSRRPWANEEEMLRVGEDLYFLSPFGYEGLIYWPVGEYLQSVNASYGGRPATAEVEEVLRLMNDELRRFFSFGYAADVARSQYLLHGLLHPVSREEDRAEEVNITALPDLPAVA